MQHAHQLTQSKGQKKKDCDRSHESEVYFFRVLLTLELLLLNLTLPMQSLMCHAVLS